MEATETYRTLIDASEGLYKEKGSKFIAYAVPCKSEEEAKVHINEWRKLHHQARHVCYAYRLGVDKSRFRANDDGEPGNSAGAPILGQIQAYDLTNVLVGVVRYFGGTKLGVGGLIHAYRTAAKEALEQASIVEKEITTSIVLDFKYDVMNDVMNLLKKKGVEITGTDFSDQCRVSIEVPVNTSSHIIEELGSIDGIEMTDMGIE